MERMKFDNLFDSENDTELQKKKAQWLKERQEKFANLSESEISLLQKQELADLANDTEGDLGYVDCKVCLNKGYLEYFTDDGYWYTKDCKCMQQRKTLQMIELSGLAESLKEFTFEKYLTPNKWQEQLKNSCLKYLDTKDNWLMLAGKTGSGKSHLCTAVIGELLKRNIYCRYMPYTLTAATLKQLQYRDIEAYHEKLNSLQNCEVLYIDDLFYSEPTKADIEIAFNILDYRVKANKRTIITTERSFKELFAIKESTFSRIYHLCGEFKTDIPKDQRYNYRLKGGG